MRFSAILQMHASTLTFSTPPVTAKLRVSGSWSPSITIEATVNLLINGEIGNYRYDESKEEIAEK